MTDEFGIQCADGELLSPPARQKSAERGALVLVPVRNGNQFTPSGGWFVGIALPAKFRAVGNTSRELTGKS